MNGFRIVTGWAVWAILLLLLMSMHAYTIESERRYQQLGRKVWNAGYWQGIQQQRPNVVPHQEEEPPVYKSYPPPGAEALPYELPRGLDQHRKFIVIRNYRNSKYELWRLATGN